jgi:hypothetical protein
MSTIFKVEDYDFRILTNFLFALFFNTEDGGSTFFRNVIELLPDYTAPHILIEQRRSDVKRNG